MRHVTSLAEDTKDTRDTKDPDDTKDSVEGEVQHGR
jgi:hypothetical protein